MNESKATRYQRLRRRANAAGVLSAGVMLALIALSPLSSWLAQLAHAFASGLSGGAETLVSFVTYVALVVVLWEIAALPATLYLARRVDSRYSRSQPAIEDVLGAQVRATAIALAAALIAGGSVLLAVQIAGSWWWLVAGITLGLVRAGALGLAPALLAGLAEVRPITRPGLADRLAALARRARVPVSGIGEWHVDEDAAATALVTGVGRSRRVLVSSELARDWADEEIAVVVAHELAHHVYRDLWRALALDVTVLWMSLFAADRVLAVGSRLELSGTGDLAALPVIALVTSIVWTIATPIRHAQSRRHERRADLFALGMTDGAEAFGTAIRRLGARWLAEERPSALTRWLYYRHPSVAERLALADAYRRVRPASPVGRGA